MTPSTKTSSLPQEPLPWRDGEHPVRVAVIGDLILDEYLEGEVVRISPEAPVPIHRVLGSRGSCGGAANAACNVALAGGRASILGVWGQDDAAAQLRSLLEAERIDFGGVVTVADRPTTRKTRITAAHHQLLRVDWERQLPLTPVDEQTLLAGLHKSVCDVLLISDYGKGALSPALLAEVLAWASSRRAEPGAGRAGPRPTRIPVVVDPKGRDF